MPSRSLLNGRQIRYALLVLSVAFIYKSITQRAPFYLLPASPPLPENHSCAVHYKSVLKNCEDFDAIPGTPLVIVSCDRARREWPPITQTWTPGAPKGELFVYDTSDVAKEPVKIIFPAAEDFHPVGVSVVPLKDGKIRLFTPSTTQKQATLQVLDVDVSTGEASIFATVTDPAINSPNGVAAVSETGVFVTNDRYASRQSKVLASLELISGLPTGSLAYVSLHPDGSTDSVRKVDQIAMANGIAVDATAGKLWVASTIKGVYEYTFEKEAPWKATLVEFSRTTLLPDNLKLAADGKVYLSGITAPMQLSMTAANASVQPPSSWTLEMLPKLDVFGADIQDEAEKDHAVKIEEALRSVDMGNSLLRKGEWRWKTVFIEDGSFFPSLSTGSVVEGGKFVGVAVFGDGVMVCDQVPIQRPKPKAVKEQVQQDVRIGDDVKEEL